MLTGAAPAVLVQQEAGLAGAAEGAGQVGTVMLAATAAGRTLVHVCGQTRAAGAHPLGRGPRYAPSAQLCPEARWPCCWVTPLLQPSPSTPRVGVTADTLPAGGQAVSSQGCSPHSVREASDRRLGSEQAGPDSRADSRRSEAGRRQVEPPPGPSLGGPAPHRRPAHPHTRSRQR